MVLTPYPEPTTCTITIYGLTAFRLERDSPEVVMGAMFAVGPGVPKGRLRLIAFSAASERTEGGSCDTTTCVVKLVATYNRRDGKSMRN